MTIPVSMALYYLCYFDYLTIFCVVVLFPILILYHCTVLNTFFRVTASSYYLRILSLKLGFQFAEETYHKHITMCIMSAWSFLFSELFLYIFLNIYLSFLLLNMVN